jgi:hypothetical protein
MMPFHDIHRLIYDTISALSLLSLAEGMMARLEEELEQDWV